jgi:hypothetical protein
MLDGTVNRACLTGRMEKTFGPVFILLYLRMKIDSVLCSFSVWRKPTDSFRNVHLGLTRRVKQCSLLCRYEGLTENKLTWRIIS